MFTLTQSPLADVGPGGPTDDEVGFGAQLLQNTVNKMLEFNGLDCYAAMEAVKVNLTLHFQLMMAMWVNTRGNNTFTQRCNRLGGA